jgi:hypothetical protein
MGNDREADNRQAAEACISVSHSAGTSQRGPTIVGSSSASPFVSIIYFESSVYCYVFSEWQLTHCV